ncbi:MAG: imidazole glycerol phosphate synthase subunit HisH [Elusimicrobia bacterium]|nr:imidazole glycerol phosphate synthase subunit HisH [Elusimicrobiota bacterium]
MRAVVVVDYGRGNLRSITRALAHVGAEAVVSSDPADVAGAERVLLPGVGAFGDGMEGLRARGLVEPLRHFTRTGRPFLGICLGMQLLMQEGHEFGRHDGLGVVPGKTVRLPDRQGGARVKIPHIGWSVLEPGAEWTATALAGLEPGGQVYFVHSFVAEPADPEDRLALTPFAGERFCSALRRDNVLGFQFHPEKSGPAGLAILSRWVSS